MKNTLKISYSSLGIIAVFAVALMLAGCTSTVQTVQTNATQVAQPIVQSQPNTVQISNFAFTPAQLTIHPGDTVVWTNNDGTPHTVTSDSGSELQSDLIKSTQTFSHTFSTAGTYSYHCSVHPQMKAQVIVK